MSQKVNVGPSARGITYRIEGADNGAARIAWSEATDLRADDLLIQPTSCEERTALEDACAFLSDELRSGSVAVRELEGRARQAGITIITLRRARSRLGVRSSPSDFGGPRLLSLPPRVGRNHTAAEAISGRV